jgi:hypothetical protein
MNGSAPLSVSEGRIVIFMGSGTFRPNPAQVRWRGTARFVYIRSKHTTGSDAFHKNNETSDALPFIYLKFYVSHSYYY